MLPIFFFYAKGMEAPCQTNSAPHQLAIAQLCFRLAWSLELPATTMLQLSNLEPAHRGLEYKSFKIKADELLSSG